MSRRRADIVVLGFYVGSDAIGAARPYSWGCWCSQALKRTVILSGPFPPIIASHHPFLTHLALSSPLFKCGSRAYKFLALIARHRLTSRFRRFLHRGFLHSIHDRLCVRSKTELLPRLRSGLFSYRMPCLADLWYFFAFYRLLTLRPKIVIASHSPYIAFWVGYTYKIINPSSKLVVDYRDMWTLSRVYKGIPFFRQFERLIERLVLNSADKIVVVSQGQSSLLSSLDPTIAPCIIPNTSSIETFSVSNNQKSEDFSLKPSKFSLLYAGTLYPAFQDPEPIFETIQILHQDSVITPKTFCFDILSAQASEFSYLAERYGLSQYVNIFPILSKSECLNKMQKASCFLLLESMFSESQGIMTSKLLDYLFVGRPILLHGVSSDSELHNYASTNGHVVDIESFRSLVNSFYSGDMPYVPSFSQVGASCRSLMSLLGKL